MKTIHKLGLYLLVILLLSRSASAYYIHYTHGYAYENIGIKNDLSSSYSGAFEDAIDIWNDGINDRSFMLNSNAVNNIIDLDFCDALDYSSSLGFLFYDRYRNLATYYPWSYNTTTCCSDHQTTSFKIYVNTYMLPEDEEDDKKLWVMTHELGHSLGLDDFDNLANYRDHVMNYAYSYSTYSSPSNSEFSAVDMIWDH